MSEKNEKVFRGVWIPAEIWEAHILSWMEKCLWAEISSLGTEEKPCFASNAFLAKKFNSTESSISNMISKLKSLKMVKHVSYDGRSRKMVAVLPNKTSPSSEVRLHPQVDSDSTQGCNRDTSEVTNRELPLTPSKGNGDSLQAANAANGADAQVGKADALSSRPPNSVNTRTPFRAPKSPPIDPEKFSEFRNRANLLLGRRDATNWSAGEIKAAKANLETCEEDWKLLEKYYANRGKDGFYTRRSMLTLLNNWAGEIDKARAHYEKESENEYRCDDFKL